MKRIIINEDDLKDEEVDIVQRKARGLILVNSKVLCLDYAGTILLPGGKLENDEEPSIAAIRELKEELGVDYLPSELNDGIEIVYYQKNYPARTNEIVNRKIITYYYSCPFKGINLEERHLSESEKKANVSIRILSPEEIISYKDINPRSKFFTKELRILFEEQNIVNAHDTPKTLIKK